MHLDKLYQLYLEQAKNYALTFLDDDRTIACQWIRKIELAPDSDEQAKQLRLHSLKLFLLCLESNCLIAPFDKPAEDDKEFAEYNWDSFDLDDFSNMIRSNKDTCRRRPEVSYCVSGNRRQLVTYQNDPESAQHCYYASSKDPVEQWNNLDRGTIQNQSIEDWKERGGYEELNGKVSENSIDIPRCEMKSHDPDEEFRIYNQQLSGQGQSRHQSVQNPGSSKQTDYNRNFTERPETPKIFEGKGQRTKQYQAEQFGLSQNEQFRSPRGVFQNLNYESMQAQSSSKSPRQHRLTDEIIASLDHAKRARGGHQSNTNDRDDARQQLCARLQKVRDEMNRKPNVQVQEQIEDEPNSYHYEPITLQEPCVEIPYDQTTDYDLGVLSEHEMNDDSLFGGQENICKGKDENLVSRNVVKIETNTKINGSKREVVEEILEQEDVNIEQRTAEEENLADVSQPSYKSPAGLSPLRLSERFPQSSPKWQLKPRRIIDQFSELPQENLDDISEPYCEHRNYSERTPKAYCDKSSTNYSKLDDVSQPIFPLSMEKSSMNYSKRLEDVSQPHFSPASKELSRRRTGFGEEYAAERLDSITQPLYASTFEKTPCRSCGREYQDSERLEPFEESRNTKGLMSGQKRLPQIDTMDSLGQVSPPCFMNSFGDSREQRRRLQTIERLDDISRPEFFHSTGDTRSRKFTFDTSEKLDQVSCPQGISALANSSVAAKSRCTPHLKTFPKAGISENLDEVSQPYFMHSTAVSFPESKCQKCQRIDDITPPNSILRNSTKQSENLDDVSQPNFQSSSSGTPCQRCPLNGEGSECLNEISRPTNFSASRNSMAFTGRNLSRPLSKPHVRVSERLEDISEPGLMHSQERDYSSRRFGRPVEPTSERLDQVTQPSFPGSTRNTGVPPHQCFPQFDTSERLDNVSYPELLASRKMNHSLTQRHRYQDQPSVKDRLNISKGGKYSTKIDPCECLDEISQPEFMPSLDHSRNCRNTRENIFHSSAKPLDEESQPEFPFSYEKLPYNGDGSEWIDDICQPDFPPSFQTSKQYSSLPVDTSEKLDNISQPEYPESTKCSRMGQSSITERLEHVTQPSFSTSFENDEGEGDSELLNQFCKQTETGRPLPAVNESEALDDVEQPNFSSIDEDTGYGSRDSGLTLVHRPLSQIKESEILEDVSEPNFETLPEESERTFRQSPVQRPLPNVETCQRLESVCAPEFPSSFEDSKRSRQVLKERPHVIESEQLEDISQPCFEPSFDVSSQKNCSRETSKQLRSVQANSRQHRSKGYDSEMINNISQPFYPPSFVESRNSQSRNVSGRMFSHINNSENLENVSQPDFSISAQSGRRQKLLSRVNESEMIDDISQPYYPSSPEVSRKKTDSRRFPSHACSRINDSEHLENVSQPVFPVSTEVSRRTSRKSERTAMRRPEGLCQICDNLDDESQPVFPVSFEDSRKSTGRYLETPKRRPMPYVSNSEMLDDVSHPTFKSSLNKTGKQERASSRRLPSQTHKDYSREITKQSKSQQNDPRQKLLRRIYDSEMLDDISQPCYPPSFEDSKRKSQSRRSTAPLCSQISDSEILDNVSQPVFQESTDMSRQTSRRSENTPFRRCERKCKTCENLDEESQPAFPVSFEDSVKSTRRYFETPKRRPMAHVSNSEMLDDVSHPSFPSSFRSAFNRTGRPESAAVQKCLPSFEEFERLDDISQPGFMSSIKQSTVFPKGNISNQSRGVSEQLIDISHPTFAQFFESSLPVNGMRTANQYFLPQVDASSKLEDVSQPSFPKSFEHSRRNRSATNQGSLRRQALERSRRTQFDASEMLEDVSQPSCPSTFARSVNIPSGRRTPATRGPMPDIDLSENIESICQPDFPQSFEDSKSSTYRKNREYNAKLPDKNIADVTEPTFHSSYKESMREENLEDVSCPSYQPTPVCAQRDRECCGLRGPQRQLFPKESHICGHIERPGNFREVFETMPNYAPFEEQVASKRIPLELRLKSQLRFTEDCGPQERLQGAQRTRAGQQSVKTARPDLCTGRNRAPQRNINLCQNQCPGEVKSSTRIPRPPSARSQQTQSNITKKPNEGERLVKKSSVKFQQTKSTYSKNQQNQTNRNQSRRR